MRSLFSALLLLVFALPASASQTNIPPRVYLALMPVSKAQSLDCRLMTDRYAQFRRDAAGSLEAIRFPGPFLITSETFTVNLDNDWSLPEPDYAARALTDDIHDIPALFTRAGKPYLTTYFNGILRDLDRRQYRLCGYHVR